MRELSSQQSVYLNQIETYVARLPGLSSTATKVLATCNDPQSSPNDLNRLIALDPVLAGQVLKLINSAYYSLRQPISSLTRAIVMLGVNTVKNLVLSLAVLDRMRPLKPVRTFSGVAFWSHCVAVGVIAKCIAEAGGVPLADQEDYFICGLLHDLGKIPLQHRFPDEYSRALELADLHSWPSVEAEQAIFGFDHSTVGGLIARKWRLSAAVIGVLDHHHQPDKGRNRSSQAILTVALADLYARSLENGSEEAPLNGDGFAAAVMGRVGIDGAALDRIGETAAAEIDKAKAFLDITEGGRARYEG